MTATRAPAFDIGYSFGTRTVVAIETGGPRNYVAECWVCGDRRNLAPGHIRRKQPCRCQATNGSHRREFATGYRWSGEWGAREVVGCQADGYVVVCSCSRVRHAVAAQEIRDGVACRHGEG